MEQSTFSQTSKSYLRFGVLLFLILFAGKFVLRDVIRYFGFDKETFGVYWDYKWLLIGHISGGLLALLIGPFQFWKKLRDKYAATHRLLGRVYLIMVLTAAICSTYLAWSSSIQLNFSWAFALQISAIAWATTAVMAYISVRSGRITQHKEWMIRSYILTFSFAIFRWLIDIPFVINLMEKSGERKPTMAWFSWVVPLLIAEIIFSLKKK
jgi:uncharacterized membrane protein